MQEKPDFRIAIVVGVTLAFLIAIGNLYWQVEHMRTDMATLRQSIIAEVTKIADTATRAANESKRAPAAAAQPAPPAPAVPVTAPAPAPVAPWCFKAPRFYLGARFGLTSLTA